jgi:hypothetical protein
MSPMAEQTVSKLRAKAWRSHCLSLAKTCSIGLRDRGSLWHKEQPVADHTAGFAAMAPKIVHNDDVAGAKRAN